MVDVVIVGAGPAGMAAALAVADEGFDVIVVDEQARAGGQIFRRPPAAFDAGQPDYAPYRWAAGLIERFENHPRIFTRFRSTAFGILKETDNPSGETRLAVALDTPAGGERVEAKRILLATGAYDLPVAFPGWTKPGVMMVGAAQSLLKSQKVLAGQKIVLTGSHPLLLIAAKQPVDAGARVQEIALARGIPSVLELAKSLPAAPGNLSVFGEAIRALATLARARVKISTRTLVTEASGDTAVASVRLARVDRGWKPIGTEREIPADLLLVGYGFSPSTELARQARCDLEWDAKKGGWIVAHDERSETNVPGIYVAGEPTGIAGAERSRAGGELAGLHIAESLGAAGDSLETKTAAAARRMAGAERFSRVVQDMFEPQRMALAELAQPAGTIVCRCELVTSGEIDEILKANPFISAANAVKLECRSGMGPCQGRYCGGTVAAQVARAREISIEQAGHFTAHLPVKPVTLSRYSALDENAVTPPEGCSPS